MGTLLVFTFIAGFVTILAPCIWPLLPVVLSASSAGGRRRPLGVTLGIMTSFTIFTLSISYLEKFFHLDPDIFRKLAVIALVVFGVFMLIPALGLKFEDGINRLLSGFRRSKARTGSGFGTGYAMGFSTGMIWAPCSGPILATVATLAATQQVDLRVIAVTLVYILGLGVPLFLFSQAGSSLIKRLRGFNKYTGRIQQAFGVAIIVAAMLIYTNYDKEIQLRILNLFPSYGNFLVGIENNPKVIKELNQLKGDIPQLEIPGSSMMDMGRAPEFTGISHWLNTDTPLSFEQLRGKVVLVDFWTYTCINCVRSLPHVTGWYEKYKNNGFIVIGVHSPEFAFEKNTDNVRAAIRQFGINYPVAQDNEFKTWSAFHNRYWPAEYLIDVKGNIRRAHFGEGGYEETERAIRTLLSEAGGPVTGAITAGTDDAPMQLITPETYLGNARRNNTGYFQFNGPWEYSDESVRAEKDATLDLRFTAAKVFLVISPYRTGDRIRVLLDGQPVDDSRQGADVKGGELILDTERLYNLIDLRAAPEPHRLRLEFPDPGQSLFAFTFG